MTSVTAVSASLSQLLRRLKLSPVLDTLPERLSLARERKMPYQEFLEVLLSDEVERRDRGAAANRARRAGLNPEMIWEAWDQTAKVAFDRELWAELCTLRFLEEHHNLLLLGPVGVGKTFLANALGHIACRRGYSVACLRTDQLLKQLKASRLDGTYEAELGRFIATPLLILDDFGLDQLDAIESRDVYEIIVERHRSGSLLVTSNRSPDEWLSTMTDALRAQSAIDRLQNSAYELVVEGESYRKRQKPRKGGKP